MQQKFDYDYVVIGSGFGGSVSALRLSEKGYRVGVMEMGKRYRASDFPKSNWNLPKFLWLPALRFFGFFRMSLFKHAWILSGVGVGGGSLVYANTLLVPPDQVWNDPKWKDLNDWKSALAPFYERAKKMLGVTPNPYFGNADKLLKAASEDFGVGQSFYATNVGIYFGEPGVTVPDPYFKGEGPARTGCILCGGCMVGCQHGAKNTLDQNYLYLAEKKGAEVHPETMVVDVHPMGGKENGEDGYEIHTQSSTAFFSKQKKIFYARGVVFSAGVLGTVKLLHQLKVRGSLPQLSNQLGAYVRTNAESIIGVRLPNNYPDNLSDGIAIGSGIHIDEHTHIEAVRYPEGSDFMGLVTTLLTDGPAGPIRILKWLALVIRHPFKLIAAYWPFNFARKTIILLVMQPIDLHLKMVLKGKKRLQTVLSRGKIPTFIPKANDFAKLIAKRTGGTALTSLTEIFLDVPTTAHILGGAAMGQSDQDGVIDAEARVFNYKNMYICDGSMIGANLGVNPSLSITALSEYAMDKIPSSPLK